MFRILVAAAQPAAALPLANEPRKGDEFRGQICRNLNGHLFYLEIRPAPEEGWLLLALEEAVDHESGEPGHGQARDAEQDKEEDFKSKYGHGAILTR
ncbi:hypothetical protein NicSoilB11_29210 [Arthrobacter sp. NicSoilB11]|nr:hypothetical protein NicSoilB11_29210 [Arthrobacter sp. NicSoilB11]